MIVCKAMMVHMVTIASMMPPGHVPSWMTMPAPTPAIPADVAITIVWGIPSIPWVVPWVVPSVCIVPEERVTVVIAMIAMQTGRIMEIIVIVIVSVVVVVVLGLDLSFSSITGVCGHLAVGRSNIQCVARHTCRNGL